MNIREIENLHIGLNVKELDVRGNCQMCVLRESRYSAHAECEMLSVLVVAQFEFIYSALPP